MKIDKVWLLTLLALMDVIHSAFYVKLIWSYSDFLYIPFLLKIVFMVLRGALILSMVPLLIGFVKCKKWGFKLYYYQFPIRMLFCLTTFSFILHFTNPILNKFKPFYQHSILEYLPIIIINLLVIFGFEILRLILTIKVEKNLFPVQNRKAQ
jgi:hypothetical protein